MMSLQMTTTALTMMTAELMMTTVLVMTMTALTSPLSLHRRRCALVALVRSVSLGYVST